MSVHAGVALSRKSILLQVQTAREGRERVREGRERVREGRETGSRGTRGSS